MKLKFVPISVKICFCFFAVVIIFCFCPKTMDYSQGFDQN